MRAREGGIVGLLDPDVLRIAAAQGRILVSHDRNTMAAYFDRFIQEEASPGLLIASQCDDVGDVIEELLLIWAASDAGEWRNQRRFLPL